MGERCRSCSGWLIPAIHFSSLGFKYSVESQMEIIWSQEAALSLSSIYDSFGDTQEAPAETGDLL